MKNTDVIVVGAGVLGCFAARELAKFELDITVLEKREDVCTGISRANTGIVYTGCDTKPGTLKTQLCVQENAFFDELCSELGVTFHRCGSLMVSFGPRADGVLQKKYEQGLINGVPGIRILSGGEVREREPGLSEKVRTALYAPGTGTVEPWELCLAAFENARANGVHFRMNSEVKAMARSGGGIRVDTDKDSYLAKVVVNCAGLHADGIREMLFEPSVHIFPSAGEYMVFDHDLAGILHHIIFHEPEEKGKGLTLVPTVGGSILVGPTEHDALKTDYSVSYDGLSDLEALCQKVFPILPSGKLIRSFGAVRPNPYYVRQVGASWIPEEKSISNFTVLEEKNLFSLIGIKTPGLTCAAGLGRLLAVRIADNLCAVQRSGFDPNRKKPTVISTLSEAERKVLIEKKPDYGKILCQCREVSEGEVRAAINRGAVTVNGVKRRTGAMLGRCQGGRCEARIAALLSECLNIPLESVTLDGVGTELVCAEVSK